MNRLLKFTRLTIFTTTAMLLPCSTVAQPADTIHPGDPALVGVLPHFGADTVDGYRIVEGERIPTNTQIRTIAGYHELGEDFLLITVRHISAEVADTTLTQTILNTSDLSLIRQGVRAPQDSGSVTYALGVISGWVVPPGEKWRRVGLHPGRPVFPDDGIAPWLFGLLPLELGYEAAMPLFNMWLGAEAVQIVRVVTSEVLMKNGREVDCWKVEIDGQGPPGYDQFRWISKDSRRTIKQAYLKDTDDPEFWSIMRHWF